MLIRSISLLQQDEIMFTSTGTALYTAVTASAYMVSLLRRTNVRVVSVRVRVRIRVYGLWSGLGIRIWIWTRMLGLGLVSKYCRYNSVVEP